MHLELGQMLVHPAQRWHAHVREVGYSNGHEQGVASSVFCIMADACLRTGRVAAVE